MSKLLAELLQPGDEEADLVSDSKLEHAEHAEHFLGTSSYPCPKRDRSGCG